MFKLLPTTSALVALLSAILLFQSATAAPLSQVVLERRDAPTGYIVKYKPGANVTATHRASWIKSAYSKAGLVMSAATEDSIHTNWNSKVFDGFAIKMNPAGVAALKANPDVAYVVPDVIMHANGLKKRKNAPWGLARISHRKPLKSKDAAARNFTYVFDDSAGEGVDVYVVDTGIRTTHKQFGGRATWGATFGSGTPGVDVKGHGTHCAGTIAGRTVGVARKAHVIAVKVLGDKGSAPTSDIISGINYAVEAAKNSTRPSVISMSLGGGGSEAMDDAVRNALAQGVHVVVSAGNDAVDAKQQSPARVTEAVTVGASDIEDQIATFSNFGDVVDIFAPGVDVISASNEADDEYSTKSGTSMAAPHVSGLIAYLIGLKGNGTPEELQQRLKDLSTADMITGLPSDTVNALAYNGAKKGCGCKGSKEGSEKHTKKHGSN